MDYCVLVTDIPGGWKSQDVENHFLRKKNGGCGDVVEVVLEYDGNPRNALVLFESASTVSKVLDPSHTHEIREGARKLKVQKLDEPFQEITATLDLSKVTWNQESEKYLRDCLRLRLSKRADSVNLTGCYWQLEAARKYFENGGVQKQRTDSVLDELPDKLSLSLQPKKGENCGIATRFPSSENSLEAAVVDSSEHAGGAFGGAKPKTAFWGKPASSSVRDSTHISQSSSDAVREGVRGHQSTKLERGKQNGDVQGVAPIARQSKRAAPVRPSTMTGNVVISGNGSAKTRTDSPTNGLRNKVRHTMQKLFLSRSVKLDRQSMLTGKPAGPEKSPEDNEGKVVTRPRAKSVGRVRPKSVQPPPRDKPGLMSLVQPDHVSDMRTSENAGERKSRSTRPRSSSLSRRKPLSIQPVVASEFSGSSSSSCKKEEESPRRGAHGYADDHLTSLQVHHGPQQAKQKQASNAQELRIGKKLLKAYCGDITKAEVNVIVVPVGPYCERNNDVATAVYRAARDDYHDQVDNKVSELKYNRLLGREEIFRTLSCGLKCDEIWHIRKPDGRDSSLLKRAIGAVLKDIESDANKYMTAIAIPAIGVGSDAMDPFTAARVIVQTVADFEQRHLEEIHLIDSDPTKVKALKWALGEKEREIGRR